MNHRDLEQLTQHIFTAKRKMYYKQMLLDFRAPMMANTLEISMHLDQRYIQPIITAVCQTLEGETTEENRIEKISFEFEVFRTWWDHLKFKLNQKYKLKLVVNYQKVVKKTTRTFDVKVVRTCPHHETNYEQSPYIHLSYMFPLKIKDLGLHE